MWNFNRLRIAGVALAALAFAACGDDDPVNLPAGTIVNIASTTPELSTLTAALVAADLTAALNGDGPFTVFAPDNDAFDAVGADVIARLLDEGNLDELQRILTIHVVEGAGVLSSTLTDGQTVTTMEGEVLTIGVTGGTVTVNGATVTTADIEATNGVIHIIDEVLVPAELDLYETALLTPSTTTVSAAILAGGLKGALQGTDDLTVFAPVNAAFAGYSADQLAVLLDTANVELLQKILTFHVVEGAVLAGDLTDGQMVETLQGDTLTFDLSGATPMVNGANITTTDVVASNGVIHLLDAVLDDNLDIVDVATLNGFETLVGAVETAGLTETLRGNGPGDAGLTVFAPTDDAFAALAALPSGDDLVDVLSYHVLDGTFASSDLSDGLVVDFTLLAGAEFTVNIDGPDVTITDGAGNTVSVTATDVPAKNGLIHIVDAVLIPTP